MLAKLIPPHSSVIEFGAGRLILRKMLPEGCSYTPSDLVDRGHGTIVLDLNARTLPTLARCDVSVLSGVLEYVFDIPRLAQYLGGFSDNILCSYAVVELNRRRRREQGWVNDYTSDEIAAIFSSAGFDCKFSQRWKAQMLYRFENKASDLSKQLRTSVAR